MGWGASGADAPSFVPERGERVDARRTARGRYAAANAMMRSSAVAPASVGGSVGSTPNNWL